ncbi:MAG: IS110 family transposase [Caldimicrobium sp.]
MTETPYFCGIDVAKNSFVASVKGNGTLIKNKSFFMDSQGFLQFAHFLSHFPPNLLIGMEPTGIYHKNLLYFLKSLRYNCVVVNPYMLHQFFKFINNKPTKTDNKDSQTIAHFLEFKHNELNQTQKTPDERDSLKYFVREKERITHWIAREKTEIKTLLALLFPELERKGGIFSKEILTLLSHFPSAHKIRTTPKDQFLNIAKNLSSHRGRKSTLSPENLYELAHSSIACEWPDYEQVLKLKINRLNSLLEEREHIAKLIDQKAEKLFKKEIQILCSIPGIARGSAIYFLAEIVDIKRFANKRKLVGFCGLDPIIKQSGKFSQKFRISKRGNAHARRIIWIMAGSVKRNCPYFREYYLKKRKEGKSYKEAVIATATKLLGVIHSLLTHERCFM